MKIIFAGSGEFGVPTLDALLNAGHEVALVATQPDRPAGRGRRLTATAVARFASQHGLRLLKTADINREELPPADLLVVIAFGQKISAELANRPRFGAINLHGSRLPRFRGAAPIHAAIVAGETVTGNSVIRLAEKFDAGAILGQSLVKIGELETAGELHDRLAADGALLVLDVIEKLQNGRATETPQDESAATMAPKLSRESSRINWMAPAQQIARKIRGMYPWPGCHVRLIDALGNEVGRATLVRARPACDQGEPGKVLASGNVAAGEGAVEIVEIQPEGKRPMSLSAFRNGHPWHEGLRLESM